MRMSKEDLKALAKKGHQGAVNAVTSITASKPAGDLNKILRQSSIASTCDRLASQLRQVGAPDFRYAGHELGEYQFHPVRKWRLDFYFPQYKFAIEVEGGVGGHRRNTAISSEGNVYLTQSRHLTQDGFDEDALKYFSAEKMGISVIRVSSRMVTTDLAISMAIQMLEARGWQGGNSSIVSAYRSLVTV